MTYAAKRSRSEWSELDNWVIEELDALERGRLRSAREPANDQPRTMTENPATGQAPGDRAHAAEPSAGMMQLFSEAETTFIEKSAEWLRGRVNADMVLEEIWRQVLADQSDDEGSAAQDGEGSTSAEDGVQAATPPPDTQEH